MSKSYFEDLRADTPSPPPWSLAPRSDNGPNTPSPPPPTRTGYTPPPFNASFAPRSLADPYAAAAGPRRAPVMRTGRTPPPPRNGPFQSSAADTGLPMYSVPGPQLTRGQVPASLMQQAPNPNAYPPYAPPTYGSGRGRGTPSGYNASYQGAPPLLPRLMPRPNDDLPYQPSVSSSTNPPPESQNTGCGRPLKHPPYQPGKCAGSKRPRIAQTQKSDPARGEACSVVNAGKQENKRSVERHQQEKRPQRKAWKRERKRDKETEQTVRQESSEATGI